MSVRGDRAGEDTKGTVGSGQDRPQGRGAARTAAAGGLVDEVVVPPVEVEAARELMRAHDACRRDLMTARHRVSKMLLRHGRVYPETSTWTVAHRRWLARQQFQEPATELVFADLIASVDGLSSAQERRSLSGSRAWHQDEEWWPTVARLRCFRGVDTLTAFALHLELGGDWQRFRASERAERMARARSRPCTSPESPPAKARSRRPDRASPAGCSSRPPGTTDADPTDRRDPPKPSSRDSPTTSCRSLTAPNSGYTGSITGCAAAASRTT